MYPVVYSLNKRDPGTRELELSVQTLKNIDCWNGEIYFIGRDPKLDIPYTYLPIAYDWGKGSKSDDEICAYQTASDHLEEFIIMADDQFILKPWKLKRHHKGTLEEHIKSRRSGTYTRQLQKTKDFLEENGRPSLSYEVHIPFLVKKEQLLDAIELMPKIKPGLFIRSIIGNWFDDESSYMEDVKDKLFNQSVLYSSSDNTFDYEKTKAIYDNKSGL